MKRTLQLLIALSIISMFIVSPVAAATSQGLEWGVAVGDQWNFNIKSTDNGVTTLDEVIYMEVLTRPAIPNIVDNLTDIPTPTLNMTWANGTSLGWSALIFIFLGIATPTFIFPIGNFTLIGELYEADNFYNGTLYNSGDYWGVNLNDLEFLDASIDIHVDYLKDDGALAHWTVTTTNTTSSEQVGTLSMVRQGLPGLDIVGFIQDNLLLVGAGVVILILLVVICARRK